MLRFVSSSTNVLGILIFGSLVAAAVALRRDIESHKRLLLLATASIVYAAWSKFDQFFPAVENYWVFLTIANSPFLAAVARDLMAYGRVHPVYIWVGGFFFVYDLITRSSTRVRLGYASHGGFLAKPPPDTDASDSDRDLGGIDGGPHCLPGAAGHREAGDFRWSHAKTIKHGRSLLYAVKPVERLFKRSWTSNVSRRCSAEE